MELPFLFIEQVLDAKDERNFLQCMSSAGVGNRCKDLKTELAECTQGMLKDYQSDVIDAAMAAAKSSEKNLLTCVNTFAVLTCLRNPTTKAAVGSNLREMLLDIYTQAIAEGNLRKDLEMETAKLLGAHSLLSANGNEGENDSIPKRSCQPTIARDAKRMRASTLSPGHAQAWALTIPMVMAMRMSRARTQRTRRIKEKKDKKEKSGKSEKKDKKHKKDRDDKKDQKDKKQSKDKKDRVKKGKSCSTSSSDGAPTAAAVELLRER